VLIAHRTPRSWSAWNTCMSNGANGAGLPCSTSVPSKSVLISKIGEGGSCKVSVFGV
jgi:hypothetical protein